MVRQFAKLGIQLEIRATDYNQFQDKVLKGKQQIFWGAGWPTTRRRELPVPALRPRTEGPNQGENTPTTATPSTTASTEQMQTWTTAPRSRR